MTVLHAKTITQTDGGNTDLVLPSDWESEHNLTFTLSGNTTGNSTVSGSNIILVGSGHVTLSGATSKLGMISGFSTGQSNAVAFNVGFGGSQLTTFTSGATAGGAVSGYIQPLHFWRDTTVLAYKLPVSMSAASAANNTWERKLYYYFGIYSRHSTASDTLTRISEYTFDPTIFGNSNTYFEIFIYSGVNTAGGAYNATLATTSGGTNIATMVIGPRYLIFPAGGSTRSAGEYWLALQFAFPINPQGAGATSGLSISHYVKTMQTVQPMGIATHTTANTRGLARDLGWGYYVDTQGLGIPNAMEFSNIRPNILYMPYIGTTGTT